MSTIPSPAKPASAIMVAGLLLPVLLLLGLPQPVHLVLAAVLLTFLPGYAWIRLTPFADSLMVVLLATSTSLALTTSLALALFYGGIWSWQICVAALGLTTVGAGLSEHRRSRR